MREIKFRVWSFIRKAWQTDDDLIISRCGKYAEWAWDYEYYCGRGSVDDGEIAIQQSTGLKTKDGKEIYEGDILKAKGYFAGDREEYSIGVVYWEEVNYCYALNIYKNGEPFWDVWYFSEINARGDFELLGNIFENPELLD